MNVRHGSPRRAGYLRERRGICEWPQALALVVLLGVGGCSSRLVNNGQVNLGRAQKLYNAVQDERGLLLTTAVPVVTMNSAQADRVLRDEVTRHSSSAGFEVASRVGAMAGLYPPEMNLREKTMGMLGSQVAGLYDPANHEIVMLNPESPRSALGKLKSFFTRGDATEEMLLAHELTHALQNQHFDIHRALDRIRNDDDRKLALKSVAEGDATLSAYDYLQGGLSANGIGDLVSRLSDMPQRFDEKSPNTPAALRASMIFQYVDGTRFVGDAYKRGGWKAVDALYANPPLSTRQVMDPALYFEHAGPPVEITLAGWKGVLKGWQEAAQNTYGELMLQVILKRNPISRTQTALAQGWRGDRMVVLEKGGALTVIWIVVMRDDETAASFARIYRGILDGIPAAGAAPHQVDQRGAAVLAVIGPGAAYFAELEPALWRESVIKQRQMETASTDDQQAADDKSYLRHNTGRIIPN